VEEVLEEEVAGVEALVVEVEDNVKLKNS